MILLNTTFSVDSNCIEFFTDFMKNQYVPVAKESGMTGIILSRIRTPAEKNILTGMMARCYALQMIAPGQVAADKFARGTESELLALLQKQCSNGVAMFKTTLDIIERFDD